MLISTGAMDEAFINSLYEQFLAGHRRRHPNDGLLISRFPTCGLKSESGALQFSG
jgi:hypothetical protein